MTCRKKDNPEHHHERLTQKVKKLETRIAKLEKHQHRSAAGDFTGEPWLPLEVNDAGH